MKIIIAKHAGFCFGVRRALDITQEVQRKYGSKIFTLGDLVHNEEVLKDLEKKNIFSSREVPENSIVISRAHGISQKKKKEIKSKKNKHFDAVCPFVKKIYQAVEKNTDCLVIIFGNKEHPEIQAIVDDFPAVLVHKNANWITKKIEEKKVDHSISESPIPDSESRRVSASNSQNWHQNIFILSQSTENKEEFEKFWMKIKENLPNSKFKIQNTICSSARERQVECAEIARKVDKMIVIGGKNSNNSRELFKVAEKIASALFIQNENQIKKSFLANSNTIGVTAGASTPNDLIERCLKKIRAFKLSNP